MLTQHTPAGQRASGKRDHSHVHGMRQGTHNVLQGTISVVTTVSRQPGMMAVGNTPSIHAGLLSVKHVASMAPSWLCFCFWASTPHGNQHSACPLHVFTLATRVTLVSIRLIGSPQGVVEHVCEGVVGTNEVTTFIVHTHLHASSPQAVPVIRATWSQGYTRRAAKSAGFGSSSR